MASCRWSSPQQRGAAARCRLRLDDGGLALDNPNRPPRAWWPGDDSPLDAAGGAVLDHEINPSIAGHGGWASWSKSREGSST